jgi:hypothetical protein
LMSNEALPVFVTVIDWGRCSCRPLAQRRSTTSARR